MTFGGLALGVGMIVDAAIVVLENSFRHMEHHGKDRMTAAIDGSEEVWSAILASILTHIAVFVPLLFLEGVSSILFRQLSIVVVLLAADVAVRRRHRSCRCSARGCWSCRRRPRSAAASAAGCTRSASGSSKAMDEATAGCSIWRSPTVRRWSVWRWRRSWSRRSSCRRCRPSSPTQADEGQVQVNVELAQGTRIEVDRRRCSQRVEAAIHEYVPEADRHHRPGGRRRVGPGGGGGGR